jgi:hypothetical protein
MADVPAIVNEFDVTFTIFSVVLKVEGEYPEVVMY